MTHVYKLIDNETSEVVHIGTTKNLKARLKQHTERKYDGGGNGKFYGKNCRIESIEMHEDIKYAFKRQCEIQESYGFVTDRDKCLPGAKKGGRIGGFNSHKNGTSKKQLSTILKAQAIWSKSPDHPSKVVKICDICGRSVGLLNFSRHRNACLRKQN